MAFNDLFRIVSLRHSKASPGERARDSAPDPRLRHRRLLEGQAVIVPSPRETRLQELKGRYADLSKKITQLESVQRGVIDAYMLERQDEPVLRARAAALEAAAPSAATHSVTGGDTGATIIRDRSHFINRIETRLNQEETAVFHNIIGGAPGEILGDLATTLKLFDVGIIIIEANSLCTQIHTIEENVAEDLPTVPVQPIPSTDPIVAAVGWGDLIIARESLVGYEAREIAHIENILPGEAKLREHQRLSKTEEVTETEIITEKESEKDSQTTDRYELQAQSQETINRDFSISTGVNTSGQYGLTHVDTSLDAAFSQSESQSRSSSINTAREIVTKSVERTFERVRRLRRLTITEEIRELNRHKLTNDGGSGTPKAVSGIYLWVEKIQKIELRHYGTRMMVEFHVPEPAVSLHERAAVRYVRKKLPPFDVSPSGVHPGNYMCLAQRYGAMDVEPPPTQFIEVGWGWKSTISEEAETEWLFRLAARRAGFWTCTWTLGRCHVCAGDAGLHSHG
jgi:hypothetical protein